MTKRELVKATLQGVRPPYVPWDFRFTKKAFKKLAEHYGPENVNDVLDNHILHLGNDIGFFEDIGNNCVKDVFGVVWDRSVDKDIGIVRGQVLPNPKLDGYVLPNPLDKRFFDDIPNLIRKNPDLFRIFELGFCLYERAWTLRGMENLMMDFLLNPVFVHELFNTITDYNIAQIKKALEYDIDAVYFGDDWGHQHGLIMGPKVWKEFIQPQLQRMFKVVKDAGKFVVLHSCGDVDELFDDLVDIGLDCFNPFQPEVMDIESLFATYSPRLSFHGGLSIQKTLPYGTVQDVRRESQKLLKLGSEGSYIFSPSHSIVSNTPLENILAFIQEVQSQPYYKMTRTRSKRPIIDSPSRKQKPTVPESKP